MKPHKNVYQYSKSDSKRWFQTTGHQKCKVTEHELGIKVDRTRNYAAINGLFLSVLLFHTDLSKTANKCINSSWHLYNVGQGYGVRFLFSFCKVILRCTAKDNCQASQVLGKQKVTIPTILVHYILHGTYYMCSDWCTGYSHILSYSYYNLGRSIMIFILIYVAVFCLLSRGMGSISY